LLRRPLLQAGNRLGAEQGRPGEIGGPVQNYKMWPSKIFFLQGKIEQYSSLVSIDNAKPNTNSLVHLFNNQNLKLKRLLLKYESTTLVRFYMAQASSVKV
jgi:hypothetical protein